MDLTRRQLQVLVLVAQGGTSRTIAEELGIARDTVRTHAESMKHRLGARTLAHAVAIGFEYSILQAHAHG